MWIKETDILMQRACAAMTGHLTDKQPDRHMQPPITPLVSVGLRSSVGMQTLVTESPVNSSLMGSHTGCVRASWRLTTPHSTSHHHNIIRMDERPKPVTSEYKYTYVHVGCY